MSFWPSQREINGDNNDDDDDGSDDVVSLPLSLFKIANERVGMMMVILSEPMRESE